MFVYLQIDEAGCLCGTTPAGCIAIPDSVKSIGAWAFEDCKEITSITIPDSVTSIGEYAFYRCPALKRINIPSGVTSIGDNAFSDCTSLTRIKVPKHFDDEAVYRWGLSCGCEVIRY